MEYTGVKRSLTIIVSKYQNGVLASGYPKVYDGRKLLITYSPSANYPEITDSQFATMTDIAYNARFAALLTYIATKEPGFVYIPVPIRENPAKEYRAVYTDATCLP